mmetsp:Transcript_91111/g.167259  ORF Transcript_91111/g.167259 Transcript_91111/m.167259 type:complete len:225 (-) Transcript_91111:9-683(-)
MEGAAHSHEGVLGGHHKKPWRAAAGQARQALKQEVDGAKRPAGAAAVGGPHRQQREGRHALVATADMQDKNAPALQSCHVHIVLAGESREMLGYQKQRVQCSAPTSNPLCGCCSIGVCRISHSKHQGSQGKLANSAARVLPPRRCGGRARARRAPQAAGSSPLELTLVRLGMRWKAGGDANDIPMKFSSRISWHHSHLNACAVRGTQLRDMKHFLGCRSQYKIA